MSESGYKYYSGSYTTKASFSDDNLHNKLFEYVAADLTPIQNSFKTYVESIIDTSSLDLRNDNNSKASETALGELVDALKSVHPYYEYEYEQCIRETLKNYFNSLLLYLVFHRHTLEFELTRQKNWYFDRITQLIPSSYIKHPFDPRDCYQEYLKNATDYKAEEDKERESFAINVPQKEPQIFSNEFCNQRSLNNMLYFIFDISAEIICDLTPAQRRWLYGKTFSYTPFHTHATGQRRFLFQTPTDSLDNKEASSSKDKDFFAPDDIFDPLRNMKEINVGCDGIPASMRDNFLLAIAQAKEITSSDIYEEYEISNLQQLLNLEIFSMIKSNTMIRKCKNCGKYFVVRNRKTVYCNRIFKDNKSCSIIGSSEAFQKKLKSEKELEIYNRAYKTHYARCKKGKMSRQEFESWCDHAKTKLSDVRTGNLDIDSFEKWLKI
jgi:hypothetical protein